MTDEFGMGWLPDLPDSRDWRFAAVGAPPVLPPRVDPRPNLYPLPPYDQGSIGSCTANAVGGMFGDVDRKQGGANINPSRLQIYYDARAEDGLQGSDHGAFIRSALKVTASRGVASEETWPYDISKVNTAPPQNVYVEAERKQAIGYYRIDIRLEAMKQCLAEGYSFVLGNTLYQNYYEASHTGRVPMPQGSVIGGHAQKYVGYDDSLRAFIVQGSWYLFGDQGFVYFPYDYATNPDLSADGWTLRSLEEIEPIPDPNHYSFSAIVAVVKPGKLVLDANAIVLPDLKGRRVRISTGTLQLEGKIKNNDEDTLTVKGDWDSILALRGGTVRVETIE